MKKYALLSLLGLTSVSAAAQQKNRIELSLFQYQFANVSPASHYSPLDKISVSVGYQRALTNRVGVFVQYSGMPGESQIGYERAGEKTPTGFGGGEYHRAFNFTDLGGSYNFLKGKRHQFSARAGLSYARGNSYKEGYYNVPEGVTICLAAPQFLTEKKGYFGALAGVRYDYALCKNRLNAGLNLDARHYAGGFAFGVNYGMHLGFNF